jgi:hypothetical protein
MIFHAFPHLAFGIVANVEESSKHIREYAVLNVRGVIITTNYETEGI